MTLLTRYVWIVKICLTGWSAYKACVGENSFICFLSGSYFCILVVATVWSWKTFVLPRQIDQIEAGYLRDLEEGCFGEEKKD